METSLIGIPSLIKYNSRPAAAARAEVGTDEQKVRTPPEDTVATRSEGEAGKTDKKRWTFLFYVNGNNFLSKQAPSQLRMLEMAGGSDDHINVVAQVARKKSFLDRLTKDWSGVRRYEVPATGKQLNQGELIGEVLRQLVPPYTRGIQSTLKENLGKADMASGDTLKDFIKWGMREYPAEHYCVVMLGPSQGMKGIMADDVSGHVMKPEDLKNALEGVKAETGQGVDVLAFDASNSTQAEMLHALKDSTKYVVGSEGLVSGTGMSTPSIMFELKKSNSDKTRTPEEVAQTFTMVGSMGVSNAAFTPTVAAIDMSKVGGLANAFNALGDALLKSGIDMAHLRELVQNTQEVGMPGVTQAYEGVKDASHFAQLLLADKTVTDVAVRAAAQKVVETVDGALVGEAHRGGPYRNANGISVFMPDNYGFIRPDTFPFDKGFDRKFNYESLGFAKGSAWPKFLTEISKDTFAGRVGAKVLGQKGVDNAVGISRKCAPVVDQLGRLASSIGWYQSFQVVTTGGPNRVAFIPRKAAATIGAVGGVYDTVKAVKDGVSAYKESRSHDAIVMNGLDAMGGVAKTVGYVALVNPAAIPLAKAAATFGVAKPMVKQAYGYFMQYKQIRDSIALSGPDAAQTSAAMAAHVLVNKDTVWDK